MTVVTKVLNMPLLYMTKEKTNFIKSIASLISCFRDKVDINLDDAIFWVGKLLRIDHDKLLFMLDLAAANPYSVFGVSAPETITLQNVS